jgi:hypothetical protein
MALDDHSTDPKSHTHPVGLCRKERLECPHHSFGSEAYSGIPHGDLDSATPIPRRQDMKLSRPTAHASHRLQRIRRQIEDYFL